MKNKFILKILAFAVVAVTIIGCSGVERKRGKIYMPDMTDSRAYETYANSPEDIKRLREESGFNFNNKPVSGTIPKGEEIPYPYANDSLGYALSANVLNPIASMSADSLNEARRLYNINCAICHGEKLDGNGPLYKNGNGPYPALPAVLASNPKYLQMAEGTMYHSITYGIRMMGSYASQLNRKQRWMLVYYIKQKQKEYLAANSTPATAEPVKDSTAKTTGSK